MFGYRWSAVSISALMLANAAHCQKPATPFRSVIDTMARDLPHLQAYQGFLRAGMLEKLKSDGPWTVFVPTDEAFGKLDPSDAKKIGAPGERAIQNFTYHIARGKILAADLATRTEVATLQGRPLTVNAEPDGVILNGKAHIVKADILCKNGVIHVVDEVLLPPRKQKILPPESLADSTALRTLFYLVVSCAVGFLIFRVIQAQRKKRPTSTGEKLLKKR